MLSHRGVRLRACGFTCVPVFTSSYHCRHVRIVLYAYEMVCTRLYRYVPVLNVAYASVPACMRS